MALTEQEKTALKEQKHRVESVTADHIMVRECDAAMWVAVHNKEDGEINTLMTFLKSQRKSGAVKTELGYKYHIALFRKTPDPNEIDMFSAIIGDPHGYAQRVGKLGYHGVMFKSKAGSKKQTKVMFEQLLKKFGYDDKTVNRMIKQTVK